MCLPVQTRLSNHADASKIHSVIQPYGADISVKGSGTFQVALQNPNGIRIGDVSEGLECIDAMSENKIDLFGLSETRLNASTDARRKLSTMMRLSGQGKAVAASDFSTKEGHQAGGTAMLIQGPATGRVSRMIHDKLGRFCIMILNGQGERGLVIATVYRVCQKKGTLTTSGTAYTRQCNAHRLEGDICPNP